MMKRLFVLGILVIKASYGSFNLESSENETSTPIEACNNVVIKKAEERTRKNLEEIQRI